VSRRRARWLAEARLMSSRRMKKRWRKRCSEADRPCRVAVSSSTRSAVSTSPAHSRALTKPSEVHRSLGCRPCRSW